MRDPLASLRAFNQEVGKTESPFEREVLRRLSDAGFRVKSQWQVGYYRIDMVVEGARKRLAVECDGDRYHPMEKLAEDMERQSILERLGWHFVRIRGSTFFRNPDLAMRPVFERLGELGIPPEANNGEALESDMTLVHELEDLIQSGFEAANGPAAPESDVETDVEEDEDEATVSQSSVGNGQVESLLSQMGGTAPLETFLREFAKTKGFQRLGRNVRKSLETELDLLSHEGRILVSGGVIRLL